MTSACYLHKFVTLIIYIRKVESHVQIAEWCAPWKITSGAENLVLQAQLFQEIVSAANPRTGQAEVILGLMSVRNRRLHRNILMFMCVLCLQVRMWWNCLQLVK
jgi:hypothetical protein